MNEGGSGRDCHAHVFEASTGARQGHYAPVDRPLAQIEAVAASHGVKHLVLVQRSVYGTDNGVLLRALSCKPCRHRGVVVVDDDVQDSELDAMHDRGVRLNLVSPVGECAEPRSRFAALAPRLHRHGWHMQWYARPEHLPQIADLHRGTGVTCVLDHLAGFSTNTGEDDPAWEAVRTLAAQGAWIKLSGWYRLDAREPCSGLLPRVRRLAALFNERMVWGSDWPHALFAPQAMPAYASTWQPVVAALGGAAAQALRGRLPSIYL